MNGHRCHVRLHVAGYEDSVPDEIAELVSRWPVCLLCVDQMNDLAATLR